MGLDHTFNRIYRHVKHFREEVVPNRGNSELTQQSRALRERHIDHYVACTLKRFIADSSSSEMSSSASVDGRLMVKAPW